MRKRRMARWSPTPTPRSAERQTRCGVSNTAPGALPRPPARARFRWVTTHTRRRVSLLRPASIGGLVACGIAVAVGGCNGPDTPSSLAVTATSSVVPSTERTGELSSTQHPTSATRASSEVPPTDVSSGDETSDVARTHDTASTGSTGDVPASTSNEASTITSRGAGSSGESAENPDLDWHAATPQVCTFQITGEPSPQISTVGVVAWSTDLVGVNAARIEFRLDEPYAGELNVRSGGPIPATNGRAFLLGLKSNRRYTYHIIVETDAAVCVSPDQELTTPSDPDVPVINTDSATAERSNGFIVAATYGEAQPMIIDADGDVVWWFATPHPGPRIHLDWDAQHMWMLKANETTRGSSSNGNLYRVRMDGSEFEEISGVELSHHDFAVLPGGVTAFLMGDGSEDAADSASYLVERAADGTFTSLARLDDSALLVGTLGHYHHNALRYVARDDAYTVSDLNMNSIAKFDRRGECLWQVSDACASAPSARCAATALSGTHGHESLPNGNLLYFGASPPASPSPVVEYSLSVSDGVLTAEEVWSYMSDLGTMILGDAQRLPNGNTLVTYSNEGVVREVTREKEVVRQFEARTSLGYVTFRETLYGPPQ